MIGLELIGRNTVEPQRTRRNAEEYKKEEKRNWPPRARRLKDEG
jgi:hypothetical protein